MGKARAEGVGEKAERQEERHGEEEGGLRGGAGGHGLGFNAARRLRAAGSAMLRPNIERDGGVKVLGPFQLSKALTCHHGRRFLYLFGVNNDISRSHAELKIRFS